MRCESQASNDMADTSLYLYLFSRLNAKPNRQLMWANYQVNYINITAEHNTFNTWDSAFFWFRFSL